MEMKPTKSIWRMPPSVLGNPSQHNDKADRANGM
jgi:hypothetical protein